MLINDENFEYEFDLEIVQHDEKIQACDLLLDLCGENTIIEKYIYIIHEKKVNFEIVFENENFI